MISNKSNYPILFTLPVLSYFGYIFYKHLNDNLYMSAIDRVDFFIHEFGHLFFNIFWNGFMIIAGGTLMQLLIPSLLLIMFLFQRDHFAVSFCIWWLGTNFFYIAMYAWDALDLGLPLIGVWGGEVMHDWNYIFSYLWILQHTDMIASIFSSLAIVLFLLFFTYSFFLIINRFRGE